jgi:multiple sugar transport system substrate-binding protein
MGSGGLTSGVGCALDSQPAAPQPSDQLRHASMEGLMAPFGRIAPSYAAIVGAGLALAVATGSAAAQQITVWSGYPEMEPFYRRVAEGLKKTYPSLEVSIQAIPLREHEKRIALALPGGAAAEVLEMASPSAQRYIEAGLLKTVPDDLAALVKNPASFDPFFLTTASSENKIYGMPLFRGQGALFYNTAMFAKAGLSGPPKTMDEYTSFAEKLVQRDAQGKPLVSGWSLRLSGGGQGIAEKFWINLFQFGGELLRPTRDGKWIAGYANEAGRKALKQYLANVHTLKTVTTEMPADAEAFEREQTAMFIRESWVIGDIAKKAPNLKYATAPLPVGSIVVVVNLYSGATGEKARLAWAFAKAANEPENLVWLLDNVGWLPNRKDANYAPVVAKTPALKAFVEYPAGYKFFSTPPIGPIDEILTRAAARLVAAFGNPALATDDAAIDKALAEAADETNRILRREGLLGAN